MSVSGSRSAEINLHEFERRLRAAGAQPAGLEDPLFEIARLVEGSWPEPANAQSSASASRLEVEPPQQLETGALRPELDGLEDYHDEIVGSSQASDVEQLVDVHDVRSTEPVQKRGSGDWTLRVAALAVVGLAMIGAVFALRGGVPGLPKQAPFIAAALGPTKVQPPSEETVAGANDAGANLPKGQRPTRAREGCRFGGTTGRPERPGDGRSGACSRVDFPGGQQPDKGNRRGAGRPDSARQAAACRAAVPRSEARADRFVAARWNANSTIAGCNGRRKRHSSAERSSEAPCKACGETRSRERCERAAVDPEA